MEPQTRGHSFLGLFIQRKTWENRQLLDVVVLRVLRRQSSAYYATQPTNRVSAFGGSDISCRSIHVCVCRKEQTRATDRAAVASVWWSLPGVMVPCGCLCIVLSSFANYSHVTTFQAETKTWRVSVISPPYRKSILYVEIYFKRTSAHGSTRGYLRQLIIYSHAYIFCYIEPIQTTFAQ